MAFLAGSRPGLLLNPSFLPWLPRTRINTASFRLRLRPPRRQFIPPHRICHARALAIPSSQLHPDPTVFFTSLKASINLMAVCGFIVLMQKCGHLPANTGQVLSQVSFNVVIPCFLMSKISQTIASQHGNNLFGLPLIAFAQIFAGFVLGKLAATFLYRQFRLSRGAMQEGELASKEALITAACAFGNTVTLPLVFLNGILSQNEYSTASGYLALYMAGWSPCLWTFGYQILNTAREPDLENLNISNLSLLRIVKWLKQMMNPPLYGVLLGILLGRTPFSQLFLPAKETVPQFDSEQTGVFLLKLFSNILQPVLEAARLLGSGAVSTQAIVLASTLAASMPYVGDSKSPQLGGRQAVTDVKRSTKYCNTDVSNFSLGVETFWMITCLRLVVMPLMGLALVWFFQHKRLLPADPLCTITILVVSAMPTAQNLVVLAQVNSKTRPFAPVLANLLVKQYLVSVISLTFWITIFSYVSRGY